jgi:flagellar hook-associated protein 3
MRVSMPTIFGSIQTQLAKLVEGLQHTNAQIASEQKYLQISDNPVEVGALMGLKNESGQVTQYQSNLESGRNWLNATDGALMNINELVTSLSGLANQMATGTYTAQQRAAASQKVQQYLEEVMQAGNTSFQGNYIFSGYEIKTQAFAMQNFAIQPPVMHLQTGSTGTAASSGAYTGASSVTYIVQIVSGGATGTATYQVSEDGGQTWSAINTTGAGPLPLGSQGAQVSFGGNWVQGDRFTVAAYQPVVYQGDNNTLQLSIGQNSRLQVSQMGDQAIGGTGGANDLFQILARFKSDLEANDPQEIGARLVELQKFQAHLTAVMAGVGATINRVDVKKNAYDSLGLQLTQNISNKGDIDMVAAVNDLKSKETAYQAALLASTKVMSMSLVDYLG